MTKVIKNKYLLKTGDHRKFNVAVTRGMALCVLIGQPYVLYSDIVWKEFLEHCDRNGGYTGYPCELLQSARKENQVSHYALSHYCTHVLRPIRTAHFR
jgi:superfamily I DNA and/or RNA helicase